MIYLMKERDKYKEIGKYMDRKYIYGDRQMEWEMER